MGFLDYDEYLELLFGADASLRGALQWAQDEGRKVAWLSLGAIEHQLLCDAGAGEGQGPGQGAGTAGNEGLAERGGEGEGEGEDLWSAAAREAVPSHRRRRLLQHPLQDGGGVVEGDSAGARYAVELLPFREKLPVCLVARPGCHRMDPNRCLGYCGRRRVIANPRLVGFATLLVT